MDVIRESCFETALEMTPAEALKLANKLIEMVTDVEYVPLIGKTEKLEMNTNLEEKGKEDRMIAGVLRLRVFNPKVS